MQISSAGNEPLGIEVGGIWKDRGAFGREPNRGAALATHRANPTTSRLARRGVSFGRGASRSACLGRCLGSPVARLVYLLGEVGPCTSAPRHEDTQVAVSLLHLVIEIYSLILIAAMVISWVAPASRHPLVLLVYRATEPVLAQVRKVLPPMGGIDFSAMVVLLALRGIARFLL